MTKLLGLNNLSTFQLNHFEIGSVVYRHKSFSFSHRPAGSFLVFSPKSLGLNNFYRGSSKCIPVKIV